MELALLPVAALLLLLTTLSAPAHATAMGSTAAEILQLFFTPDEETAEDPHSGRACRKAAQSQQRVSLNRSTATRLRLAARRTAPPAETREKRHSRFASASVSYRTTAPPAAR